MSGEAAKADSNAAQIQASSADTSTERPANDALTSPPLERRISSSQQPLRHGRKPIYPDSDAEAEGLDADVDDEELETGLAAGQGDHERSSLLGASGRTGAGSAAIGPLDRAWLKISKLWGGDKAYSARLVRRRKQRRSAAQSASRRNSRSIHTSSAASFAAWRHEHPYIMRSLYTVAALFLTVLLLLIIAVTHLYTGTLKSPSPEAQSRILDESLLLKGPDRVQLLNISDEGILVRVDARLGLDPDHALDLWLGDRGKQGWWKNRERKLVEWAMGKVAGVQVDIEEVRLAEIGAAWSQEVLPSTSFAVATSDPQDMLAFHLDPLILPLPPLNRRIKDGDDDDEKDSLRPPILGNHSTPAAQHNMSPLNLTVLLKPVVPAPYIMEYAEHAVKKGIAQLDVKIAGLRVRGLAKSEIKGVNHGRKAGFFDVPRRIDLAQHNIRSPVQEKVPKLNETNTDDLIKLDGYEFFEIGKDEDGNGDGDDNGDKKFSSKLMRALGIKAIAQANNPLGKMLQGSVRYSLPFGIYLPVDDSSPPKEPKHPKKGNAASSMADDDDDEIPNASVLMAAVATEPFALTGQKIVDLELLGRVVPPPQSVSGQTAGSDEQLAFTAAKQDATYAADKVADSPQSVVLSNFLSRFLRGLDNTVFVRGGSPFKGPNAVERPNSTEPAPALGAAEEMPGDGSDLPDWMDSALRLIDLPISFPGSKVTDLLKNVTINDLKITPHPFENDKLLCSGTVMGVMDMPGQLSSIDVRITHLWPDILVYDGKPPSMRKSIETAVSAAYSRWSMIGDAMHTIKRFAFLDSFDSEEVAPFEDDDDDDDDKDPKKPKPEPAPPLPDPLPEKAFGRVRPHDFAPAETTVDPTDPKGERKLLRAVLKDVPFTVLPGRSAIFRSFTWKLITGQGALVGIEGTSKAKIWNSGLGQLQLSNLPVKGAFMMGKRD